MHVRALVRDCALLHAAGDHNVQEAHDDQPPLIAIIRTYIYIYICVCVCVRECECVTPGRYFSCASRKEYKFYIKNSYIQELLTATIGACADGGAGTRHPAAAGWWAGACAILAACRAREGPGAPCALNRLIQWKVVPGVPGEHLGKQKYMQDYWAVGAGQHKVYSWG